MDAVDERNDGDQPRPARAALDAAQPEHHRALVLLEDPDRQRHARERDEHECDDDCDDDHGSGWSPPGRRSSSPPRRLFRLRRWTQARLRATRPRGTPGSGRAPSHARLQAIRGQEEPSKRHPRGAIVGRGKPTLVKVISGIYSPDHGEISMDGVPVAIRTPEDATQLGIATVYQDLALADNLDVVANLFLGREVLSRGPARATWQVDEIAMEHRSHELLERFAVTIPNVRTEVAALSGGQRQQVAVARSLLGEPKIVLLDEPTAALGVAQTAQVLLLIKQLRERGLGVIVISHNLADVFEVADRIVVLRLGRRVASFDRSASQDQVVSAITGADIRPNGREGAK